MLNNNCYEKCIFNVYVASFLFRRLIMYSVSVENSFSKDCIVIMGI